MNLDSLICRIWADIGADADVLPKPLMREYINDALCQIQQIRPELFSVTKSVKAEAGDLQRFGCCDLLLAVDAITDKDGAKIGTVTTQDVRMARISGLFARCTTQKTPGAIATPQTYTATINPVSLGEFTVSPPVPKGADVWFRVRCSSVPKYFDDYEADASVPCAQYSLILLYAKSMALSKMSPDSASARAEAKDAMAMFVQSAKNAQSTALNIRRAA